MEARFAQEIPIRSSCKIRGLGDIHHRAPVADHASLKKRGSECWEVDRANISSMLVSRMRVVSCMKPRVLTQFPEVESVMT